MPVDARFRPLVTRRAWRLGAIVALCAAGAALGALRIAQVVVPFDAGECRPAIVRPVTTDGSAFVRAGDASERAARLAYVAALLERPQVVASPGAPVAYLGRITDAGVDALADRLAATPDARAVLVSSFGGDEHAAVRFAHLLADRGLGLVVHGFCASACANYLVPAAEHVRIQGLVLFHGSPANCLRQASGFVRHVVWPGVVRHRLERAAQREADHAARWPMLRDVVATSAQRPARGDPSGQPRAWLAVAAPTLRGRGIRLEGDDRDAERQTRRFLAVYAAARPGGPGIGWFEATDRDAGR